MKNKSILVIAGEPNSIFLEIFFKSIKYKKFKSPIILICCKKILTHQMRKNKIIKKINTLEINKLENYNLDNNNINLIDIECHKINGIFNPKFTNEYLYNSFELAIKLIKKKFTHKLINGPIIKKNIFKKKIFRDYRIYFS